MLNEAVHYYIKVALRLMLRGFYIFPVKNTRIFLLNELSYTYGDSTKYLYLYFKKHRPGKYELVYPLAKLPRKEHEGIVLVKKGTLKYFYYIMTSRVVITNAGGVSYIPKRKGQLFINTWHGGGPYKKTSTDVYNNFWYRKEVKMNCENTDYILSSCKNFTEVEAASMGFTRQQCIPTGLPRNDILFGGHEDVVKKVRDFFSIPKEKRFILYAPTFRSSNNQSTSRMIANQIDLDFDKLLSSLKGKFGCDWMCGVRLHPKLADVDLSPFDVVNCTKYPDVQELLCCADAIITDYSSLMWDYSFTYRPIFLYALDIEEYEKERGFYMPIAEWPFPIAHDNDEMGKIISEFQIESYVGKVKEHHKICESYDEGRACAKVLDLIEST